MDYIFQGRTNLFEQSSTPDGSLIIALHGGYGTPVNFRALMRLELLCPNSHVLYVDAEDSAINLWRCGASNVDVVYIHALIEKVILDYPIIDRTKIHLLGYSNGGMMCYKLAAVLDELNFKTITVIAGCYLAPETFDSQAKVLHMYGDEDTTVPVAGNATYPALSVTKEKVKVAGTNAKFLEVQGVQHDLNVLAQTNPILFNDIKSDIKKHMGL